jgi:hypothetical protein
MKLQNMLLPLKFFLTGFFIVAVVVSAVFLVYIYVVQLDGKTFEKNPARQEKVSAIVTMPETTAAPYQVPGLQTPEVKLQPEAYTVFIAAYPVRPPAAEEVGRWQEAQYDAAVWAANRHYSVALGRYATAAEARRFAGEMSDAFENGYFIGKIK